MTLLHKLHKFIFLKNSDRQLLLLATLTLIIIRLGLWLLPWKVLYAGIRKFAPISPDLAQPDNFAWYRVVKAVNRASKLMLIEPKCLARALTTQILLIRQGYGSELCIGVAKNQEGKFEAHAWVENEGKIIIGKLSNHSQFIPLPSVDKLQYLSR